MVDVLTLLQQFLCYNNNSCMQQFQQYAYKPMEGIFYAVLFPIVFILIFVYIISIVIGTFSESKKFRILIAVIVFAFIILQGWYGFFISISNLWLYVLVFLGFIWMLLHTFIGSRGSSGKARTDGLDGDIGGSNFLGSALGRVGKDLRKETRTLEKEIDMAIDEVKIIKNAVERGDTQSWRMATAHLEKLHTLRREYLSMLKGPMGFRVGGKFKEYEAKIDRAIKELQNIQNKAPNN